MKILIVIFVLLISSCAEMEATNTRLDQKQNQSLSFCNDYAIHESGLLVASCSSLETKNRLEKQKEILLPRYCLTFVVDEEFTLSDHQFESAEYKNCRTIVLEELTNN